MFDIIGKRKIYYAISGIFIGLAVLALISWQLKLGIDFKGGSILEIKYEDQKPQIGRITGALEPLGLADLRVSPIGEKSFILRFAESDEATHQNISGILQKETPAFEESRFSGIGPTIGREMKKKSLQAIILVLLGISFYIAFVFRRVSRPVNSWMYGLATLLALFHDLVIPIGLFAVLNRFYGVEVGLNFIVALLVILGFSVHDTIVVFDRIRENLKRYEGADFETLVNKSVNETFVRSVNTSLTVLLTLGALLFWGGDSLRYFILALTLGIFSGTYSSIFIASPILVTYYNWRGRMD